ncbi:MAG TPA: hypothetical protein VGD40_26315 [Chryseosolibacter sp.]
MKTAWLCIILLFLCVTGQTVCAQILIEANDLEYSENFDDDVSDLSDKGLLSHANTNAWVNNSTIVGWYAAQTSTNDWVQNYRGDNLTNGSLYSYGTVASERALGSLTTNASGDVVFGVLFQNNTVELQQVQISFKVEHWRRSNTTLIGYQRTKVSYAVADPINLTPAYLFNDNNFIELPEAFLVSIDTEQTQLSLDGNSVSAIITVRVPVTIPAGSQFFLRFDDDNLPEVDIGMGIDDVQVIFSADPAERITATSGYSVFPYLDMGIVADIEDENSTYIIPSNSDIVAWTQILNSFYDDNSLDDVDGSAYGYEAVEFTDVEGTVFHVLRKTNNSGYSWGTYVKPLMAGNAKLLIQSPHAFDDTKTGTQSAAVFDFTDAKGLMVSGISRCASDEFSSCSGETDACVGIGPDEKFRRSDVSHEPNSIYHLASTIVAALDPSLVFVQLHGFGEAVDNPDLIVSCGTKDAGLKGVPDYAVILRENLSLVNPGLDVRITHVDQYPDYAGTKNVQGRHLNLYPANICTNDAEPTTVTNRFLHIEQFPEYRSNPSNYIQLANALSQTINQNAYVRAISVTDELFFYEEKFENFYNFDEIHPIWGNNVQVLSWYAAATIDELFSKYHIAHGQLSTGGIYSFGPEGSTERALGSIATSGSALAGDVAYGILFKNESFQTIYGVELTYDSEQWRDSDEDGVQTVELSYRIADQIDLHPDALLDNNAFTHFPNGDLHSTDEGTSNQELVGNTNAVPIHVIIPFELAHGKEIFIRFFDRNDPGFDKAMAIDNFTAQFLFEEPMPVDWRYFKISGKMDKPVLQWGAENETECMKYDVLRSDDGLIFETIGTLGCKKETGTNHYEFIDGSPPWRKNTYYKIVQYDENGDVTFSPVKSFTRSPASEPRVYYSNGQLIIETDQELKLKTVNVFDFVGRVLCSGVPSPDNSTVYRFPCYTFPKEMLIVQLIFETSTYVVHLRLG